MIDSRIVKLLDHPDAAARKKAVTALAKSGEPEALMLLARVYRSDDDGDVRELARKAGIYLKRQLEEDDEFAYDDEDAAQEDPVESLNRMHQVSETDKNRANALVQQALDESMRGEDQRAFRNLVRAFSINPGLEHDTYASSLAAQITGLPRDEAIDRIKAVIQAGGGRQRSGSAGGVRVLDRMIVFLLVLVGAGLIGGFLLTNWIELKLDGDDMMALMQASDPTVGIPTDGLESRLSITATGIQFFNAEIGGSMTIASITIDLDELTSELEESGVSVEEAEPEDVETASILAPITGAVTILIGVIALIAAPGAWYWVLSLILTLVGAVPFVWLYLEVTQEDFFGDFDLTFTELGIASGLDVLGTGYWLGVGLVAAMGLLALLGVILAPSPES
jgi:hypothetical protein